jgi:type 1 glutamine amidotransferase
MGDSKLVQLAPDSPVCRGWKEYDLHEEFYLGMKFLPSATQVLSATVGGKNETVAWTYERPGGGRSFGTTLAHFHANFKTEAFRRAIVNGILWSAGVDVPAGGADVSVTDEDLSLPPQTPAPK